MRAGRHDPLLEVEPSPAMSGHYQIVCGEQRWRAAREAGMSDVLVRLHPPLGYLERLLKQHEENHLRSDLDPVEDAGLVLLAKSLTDIAAAERILNDAAVPFQPLDGKRITDRGQIDSHLAVIKDMLVDNGLRAAGLSPWRETERALGLSEASRKAKLAVLRLEPDILEEVRGLPAHHASLIARVTDPKRRAELVARAPQLSNRQLHAAIRRLRADHDLEVADALDGIGPGNATDPDDPLRLEAQLTTLVDLCRQVVRILANLRQRVAGEERQRVADVLRAVASASKEFGA
jgi:hypothetical protein